MSFINSNIIRFHGKSRKGSENVEIREHILTLQNLYHAYHNNLQLLGREPELQDTDELAILKTNMQIIEKQIERLTALIK